MNQSVRPSPPSPSAAAVTRIVGIGASAGGLEAFTELLRNLPPDAGVAYVLVQHLDPTHRSLLSELLAKVTPLPVTEIVPDTVPEPNRIYVIPPNCDLSLRKGLLRLRPRSKDGGPARSIDSFLKSLAAEQKERAIGVILSGAGSDGAEGLRAIKDAGGLTFAQDGESAKYDSMPRSAVATNCVDFVLPPDKIAEEICRLLLAPNTTRRRAAKNAKTRGGALARRPRTLGAERGNAESMGGTSVWPAAPDDPNLRKLFVLLRARTGVDFSFYRPNTIRRRLTRRLTLHKMPELERYLRYLRENPEEIDALYQDLLINVTSFFRNPAVFQTLKKRIFPKLVKNIGEADCLRFWVAGCSTGQEPYSIAIAYAEFAEEKEVHLPLQIFASDVNGSVLELARAGRYSRAQVEGVSAARLQRFFDREHDGYRVNKSIRDVVIFAQQNVVTDPPFTRVDLVSCRNMLIYLEQALQQKIIPAFHYALRPNGFLVLGSSESTGQFGNLFSTVEARQKIFQKKPGAAWLRYERPPSLPPPRRLPPAKMLAPAPRPAAFDAPREAERLLLARYAPVSLLVTEEGEIIQFRGDTRRYLDLPAGKATFQLLKMARHGLAIPLQRALLRARKDGKPAVEKEVRFGGNRGSVTIEVVPLKNSKPLFFLIAFLKPTAKPVAPSDTQSSPRNGGGSGNGNGHDTARLSEAKQELSEMRDHLHNLQEEYDTSIEELQASNEEVQSANEELQSLNEELETSNEELESSNEELTTLNEELATRNSELRESERRLREQAELLELAPVLARSAKDRIIFWNVGTEKLYGFTKEEALGQTSHLLLGASYPEPLEKIQARLLRQGHWEGEVAHRRKNGETVWVYSQWVVHQDEQQKVRAVLEVNADITGRKLAEKALLESEKLNRSILESSPDCIKLLDAEARLVFISPRGQQLMEIANPDAVLGAYWPSLWEGEGRTAAEQAYREASTGRTARFQAFRRTVKGTPKWWDVLVQPIPGPNRRPERLLAASRDITDYKMAETQRAQQTRLTALRADIALALARGGDVEVILKEVARLIVRHLDAAIARIWIAPDDGGPLHLVANAGPQAHLEHAPTALEDRIARILSEKKPYFTSDMARDFTAEENDWAHGEGIVSFAGHPLWMEDRPVGVIALFTHYKLDPKATEELGLSSDAISQYIERKRAERDRAILNHQAMEARKEVAILNEIGHKLAAELDQQKLAQAVTNAATQLTKAEFGTFFYNVVDEKGESYSLYTKAGSTQESFSEFPIPQSADIFHPTFTGKTILRSDDITKDPRYDASALHYVMPAGQTEVRSYLAVPVVSRSGETIGGLFFGHSRTGVFTDREERLAVGLAAQAAVAMDNARLFGQLERKVNERTARLQETISELQAFSYTVSHDLRAPLRAMQSYAQVLQEECAPHLDEQGRSYLTRIEQAGMRLDRLIQDVLTYGRISRNEIARHPLDLERLIHEIIEQYPALQPPKATIEIEGTIPTVLAEESSSTQCFSNLLGNAVKFVPPAQHPVVRIRAETRGEKIRVWVQDNGIGIAPEFHDRIFKMFERVDHELKYDGTGIGLAIVRKAMERMGGQVGLESELGRGSNFWLEFEKAH